MFFTILSGLLLGGGIFAAIKFPSFLYPLTSLFRRFIPSFNFGKWFKNTKTKTSLQDRYFFKQNINKIQQGTLFIVLGKENYKIYDLLAPVDSYGVKKNFEKSEEAFEILEYNNATFLFIHPNLISEEKRKEFGDRVKPLIKRICSYRRQKYIDGLVIFPNSEIYQLSDARPSIALADEINFCSDIFQKISDFFKLRIPVYFLAHNSDINDTRIFKNPFKHDGSSLNTDIYLGFSCDFTKKSKNQKVYEFFQDMLSSFVTALDLKTSSILNLAALDLDNLDAINALYRVKMEDFYISKNYISYFLENFETRKEPDLINISILNSILFASFEGSNGPESLANIFKYLGLYGKDKIIFSEHLLNVRNRINIAFSMWTFLFVCGGAFSLFEMSQFLKIKRTLYIKNSIEHYQKFAKIFNNLLFYKFPFSDVGVIESANYDSILYVFTEFKKITNNKQAYFYDHIDSLTHRADIQDFVNQMKSSEEFLSLENQISSTSQSPFTFNIKFDFRTQIQNEFRANRIVNWTISAGSQSYGSKYGAPQHTEFTWTYGESLTFSLEFVDKKNAIYASSLVPTPPPANSPQIQNNYGMSIQKNVVTFSYINDNWSLLRFIENHDTCQDQKKSCPEQILQFIIPLANQSNVVFFCTLELQNVAGKKLTFPIFPKVAPLFAEESVS